MFEMNGLQNEGVFQFSIKGRFDTQNSLEAEEKLVRWIQDGENILMGNLSDLDYISSSGLKVLLLAAKILDENNGKIALYGMPENIRKVFEIVELPNVIPTVKTQEEAKKILNL